MDLKCTKIDLQEPKESNDVRFVALGCIVFELLACENSAENFLLKVAGINLIIYLLFNYFYRFFNRNLMICLKTAEQVCHDLVQFLPLNAVVERQI